MERFGPFAVTYNSDIRNNNVGLQDVPLSELCVHQLFLTKIKKDLSMLLAFLLSSWPPSELKAVWMIFTMSSLNSSWKRGAEIDTWPSHVFDRYMNPAALEAQNPASNLSKRNRKIKAFCFKVFQKGHIYKLLPLIYSIQNPFSSPQTPNREANHLVERPPSAQGGQGPLGNGVREGSLLSLGSTQVAS